MVKSSSQPKRRFRKEAVYQSFVWQKPLGKAPSRIRSAGQLLIASWLILKHNLLVFSLLSLVFLCVAYVLFLSASPITDLGQLQQDLQQRRGEGWSAVLSTSLSLLPNLIALVGQYILDALALFVAAHLILSLALWWLIRRLVESGKQAKIKIRDALYFGPAQIVPFTLLTLTLSFQLLPALIVTDFATQLRVNETLQSNWEQAAALLVVIFIYGICFYWFVGGFFSVIVGSLPGTRPFKAWQTSLQLTHRRRLPIASRLFFMLSLSVLGICLLSLPFLAFIPRWAEYGFYLLALGFFILSHIYCFLLYSDLLKFQNARQEKNGAD